MADGSGMAGVLSLPKGGGALSGLGESFTPDLHTGTGNLTVPIAVPRGRNGFQPELALVYSTGHGDDCFGLGWALNIPEISRKTAKGVPRYNDSDVFTLSQGDELVPIEHNENDRWYRPRAEGAFADIVHHRGAGRDDWTVRTTDGLVSRYGRPVQGRPAPVTASRDDPPRIFAWKLASTEDPFGNKIEYTYEHDPGSSGAHRWDRTYLRSIGYINVGDRPDTETPLVTVEFEYEDRPDPRSQYRTGFEIRTRKRCSRIVVWSHAQPSQRVRTYEMVYRDHDERAPSMQSPLLSQLMMIRTIGHDGDNVQQLPPLTFDYERFTPQRRRFVSIHGADLPAVSLADPGIELIDVFGNGLPSLVELKGAVRYWRNLGDGSFDRPRYMADAPAGVDLRDPGVGFFDADGDGLTDLLVNTDTAAGYFPMAPDGRWSGRSFQRYRRRPSFVLDDPAVRLVDLDGNGTTDAVRSGARFECFFHDAQDGWTRTKSVERKSVDVFPDVDFADRRVRWADMTGDGLLSIVLVNDGRVEYWPQLGHGEWGPRVLMTNSPRLPWGYDPRRVLLGDVDGDGRADLLYVDDGKVTLWLNHGADRWSAPVTVTGTPRVSDATHLRMVDLLGSGVDGLLWSSLPTSTQDTGLYFLDFTGGRKPYLLSTIDNQMGALTRVSYSTSTRFYAEDRRRPETRWDTRLPFPVHVVEGVDVVDHFSGGQLSTRFRYRHGAWDGREREFCGFGVVEQVDTDHTDGLGDRQGAEVVPVLTRTWFHQGALRIDDGPDRPPDRSESYWNGDPRQRNHQRVIGTLDSSRQAQRCLRGKPLRREVFAMDGSPRADRPYSVAEFSYSLAELHPPTTSTAGVYVAHPDVNRDTRWERGVDPLTHLTVCSYVGRDEKPDRYGRLQSTTAIACPRGWRRVVDRPADGYLATRVCLMYADGADGTYLHDRVARETSFEIVRTSGVDVDTLAARPDDSIDLTVLGQVLRYYDGPAFTGLPLGKAGRFGAMVRSERLVLTPQIVADAYGADTPPYLRANPPPNWPAHYPADFADRMPTQAGYGFRPGSGNPFDPVGFFAQETRCRFDFHDGPGRGLIREVRGPTANASAAPTTGSHAVIAYDAYDLLAVKITDAAGLSTTARHDYRLLKPTELSDPNGNRSTFTYSALGLLKSIAHHSKSATEGDSARSSVTMDYGLDAFEASAPNARQPVFVRTTRFVHHDTDTEVPQPQRDATIAAVEYSDGFGRLLQVRTQGERIRFGDPTLGGGAGVLATDQDVGAGNDVVGLAAAPGGTNVVVSGAQTYDRKGRVIEKYEPYFAEGWAYRPAHLDAKGQHITLEYDPLGRLVSTATPDGARTRVVIGRPPAGALDHPERFEPTPWETYSYDATDNAGRTHATQSLGYEHHWDTPSSILVDALGRTVLRVERNRLPMARGEAIAPVQEISTRLSYDIRGNLITVVDHLGRIASRARYDLTGRQLWEETPDGGWHAVAVDAAGQAVESRDAKGAVQCVAADRLGRVDRIWARDHTDQPLTLRVRITHGDAGRADQPAADRAAMRAANALGRPTHVYDEAGLLTFDAYDHSGNAVQRTRRVLGDSALLAAFAGHGADWEIVVPPVDWSTPAAVALDARSYVTRMRFDALGRTTAQTLPTAVDGTAHRIRPEYNAAGLLDRLLLESTPAGGALSVTPIVDRIAYDAKGLRVLLVRGNDIMTRYAYEPDTFLLKRLRSDRVIRPALNTLRPSGKPLQDSGYGYDLEGNVTDIHDRAPGSGISGSPAGIDRLDRHFKYDALHQLVSATGRCNETPAGPPWSVTALSADPTRTRAYTETYQYNAIGAMTELKHESGHGTYKREHAMAAADNRLHLLKVGGTTYTYSYDAVGNLLSENTSRHLTWDHSDRLTGYRNQTAGAEPSVFALYRHAWNGDRVVKWVRRNGGALDITVSIDGVYEHRRVVRPGSVTENSTLRVSDGDRSVASVRTGPTVAGDPTPAVTFTLDDAPNSVSVTVGGPTVPTATALIDREEFTPYGETSFGSYGAKRYRFAGKQRDEESGLYCFGARYYLPWACRFASCDPLGAIDGLNVYGYARNSPLTYFDPDGRQAQDNQLRPGERDPVTSNPVLSADSSHNIGDIADMIVTGDANAPLPFELPQSNPDALKRAEGRGRVEGGDVVQFFKGLWNGPSSWVDGPQFKIDPYHEGAAEAGSQLGKNLVIEAATAGLGKVIEWAAPAARSGARGGEVTTNLSAGRIRGGMSTVDPKKEKLWLDWLTKRGVRVEAGTEKAEQALDAAEKARKLAPDTVRGMTETAENAQGGKDVVIYLRKGYNAAEFYEECLHAFDALKGKQKSITILGVIIDLFELRAKITLINSAASRELSSEEVKILKKAVLKVLAGTYP